MFMRYRGGGVGHWAVWEATNTFLKDRPCEELDVGRKDTVMHAAKENNGPDGDESEDEKVEPASHTEQIDPKDIPMGDEIEEEEEEEEEEEAESASDSDKGESDEVDSDGEVDDTLRYAEL